MPHLVFGFYLLALSSSIFLLSTLLSKKSNGNTELERAFAINYGLVTLFLFLSTVCLYVLVNIPMLYVFHSYISIIYLFLGLLPFSIAKSNQIAFQLKIPMLYKVLLRLQIVFGFVMACVAWWLSDDLNLLFLICMILIMTFSLIANTVFAKSSVKYIDRSPFEKRLSSLMVIQSITLPLIEVLLFNEHLSAGGLTVSLPVICIVNNFILLRYKEHLLPTRIIESSFSDVLNLLSPKEQKIAQAVSKGLSNKQIAFEMSISPSTVKNHMSNIFKKCNVTNRVSLVTKLQKQWSAE